MEQDPNEGALVVRSSEEIQPAHPMDYDASQDPLPFPVTEVDISENVAVSQGVAIAVGPAGISAVRCHQLRLEQVVQVTTGEQQVRFSRSGTYSVLQEIGVESPEPGEADAGFDDDIIESQGQLPPPAQVPLLDAPPQAEEVPLQLPAPAQVLLLPPPPERPALSNDEQAAMEADVENSKQQLKRAREEAEPLSSEDGPLPPSERAQAEPAEAKPAPARVPQTSAVRASSSSSTSSSSSNPSSRSKSSPSGERVEGATGGKGLGEPNPGRDRKSVV